VAKLACMMWSLIPTAAEAQPGKNFTSDFLFRWRFYKYVAPPVPKM
jgi:hypothetical protein